MDNAPNTDDNIDGGSTTLTKMKNTSSVIQHKIQSVVIKYILIPISKTIPNASSTKTTTTTEQHESVLRLETVSRPHVRTTGPRRHRAEGRRVPENGGEFQTVVHGREGIRIRRESISSSHTEFYVPRRRFYER